MYISRLLLFITTLLSITPVIATTVLPLSLQELTNSAQIIFYGKTVANNVSFDNTSGRVATFTRFQVLDTIKGKVGADHTIKQIGGQLPGSKVVHRFHGVPTFTIGEEYVVFIPPQSKIGFSSPVGLSQGKFSVIDINGKKAVSNGRAINKLLSPQQARAANTTSLKALVNKPSATDLEGFIQTVRELSK